MTDNSSVFESIFVARQPVFNLNQNIWGYELLFRQSSQVNKATISDADMATSQVIADGFSLAVDGLPPGRRALVNFPVKLLLQGAATILPPEIAVIEILEDIKPTPQVLAVCTKLKKAGYTLALDDFIGEPGYEAFFQFADIVKVDVLNLDVHQIKQIVHSLKKYPCQLLAEKVEDMDMFNLTKGVGFELFQGYFFSKPEILPGRKLSSHQTAKLQLLKELSQDDFSIAEIEKIIQTDLALSYRLLRYINSASFSLSEKVESIRRAVAFLGKQKLLQWLRVALLADMNQTNKGRELIYLSTLRARYLQQLSQKYKTPLPAESMFLLGFFSLLDAILEQPMEELIGQLPLDNTLIDALINTNNPASFWIQLAAAQEKGDWSTTNTLLQQLKLPPGDIAMEYVTALQWTQVLLKTVHK